MTSTTANQHPRVVDATTPTRLVVQRLRNTLRMNATTSLLGGLVAALVPGTLDRFLGTGHPGWVRLVGVGLAVFAIDVLVVAGTTAGTLRRWTAPIVAADAAWVLATGVTIAAGWYSTSGAVIVGAVGVMVAALAIRQHLSLRKLRRAPHLELLIEDPPVEVAHVEARIDAPTSDVWPVVIDHDLYGRLAPNLGSVRATGPNGPSLARVCSNRSGQKWSETCTLWDEGHRFDITVDTSDYPYPLVEMRGSWSVRPHSERGSLVAMDFRYQPTATLKGRAFAIVMQAAFPVVLRQIARGWRREALSRRREAAS